MSRDTWVRGALVTMLAVLGCEEKTNTPPGSDPSTWGPDGGKKPSPNGATASTTGAASATSSGSGARTAEALTDADILGLLEAANDKEIEESKVAEERSKNADVKAFAKMMVDHHGDAKKKVAALPGLPSAKTNDDAKKLRDDTRAAVDKLKSVADADFDATYVDLMVKDHEEALALVSDKLLPAAASADLKKALETDLRPTIEGHLKRITEIKAKVGGAPAVSATAAPGTTGTPAPKGSAMAPAKRPGEPAVP
jgi:putative membrane protein